MKKSPIIRLDLIGLVTSVMMASAFAQEPSSLTEPSLAEFEEITNPSTEVVKKITPLFDKQAQSIRYFNAPDNLMAVGVVTNTFKKQVYYTNQNGDFVMSGRLYETDSKLMHDQLVKSELKVLLPEEFTNSIETAPSFSFGKGEQVIYAVVDANCGYCKRFHQTITKKIETGELANVQVKFIPVGALGQDSTNKAKAILSLPNDEQFKAWEAAVNRQPISMTTTEQGAKLFEKTQGFFRSQSIFGGVPFVITRVNGDWMLSNGDPNNQFYSNLIQAVNAEKNNAMTASLSE